MGSQRDRLYSALLTLNILNANEQQQQNICWETLDHGQNTAELNRSVYILRIS